MSGFAPELQVRQYVAEVNAAHGFRFRVFATGSARHYLLVCVQNAAIQAVVAKADLQPGVRRMLARGVGHAPKRTTP